MSEQDTEVKDLRDLIDYEERIDELEQELRRCKAAQARAEVIAELCKGAIQQVKMGLEWLEMRLRGVDGR